MIIFFFIPPNCDETLKGTSPVSQAIRFARKTRYLTLFKLNFQGKTGGIRWLPGGMDLRQRPPGYDLIGLKTASVL
jgi:hypothetical protein